MWGYLPIANSEPPSRYTKGFHPQKYTSKKSNPNITTAFTNYKTKKRYWKNMIGGIITYEKRYPTDKSDQWIAWHTPPRPIGIVCHERAIGASCPETLTCKIFSIFLSFLQVYYCRISILFVPHLHIMLSEGVYKILRNSKTSWVMNYLLQTQNNCNEPLAFIKYWQ